MQWGQFIICLIMLPLVNSKSYYYYFISCRPISPHPSLIHSGFDTELNGAIHHSILLIGWIYLGSQDTPPLLYLSIYTLAHPAWNQRENWTCGASAAALLLRSLWKPGRKSRWVWVTDSKLTTFIIFKIKSYTNNSSVFHKNSNFTNEKNLF